MSRIRQVPDKLRRFGRGVARAMQRVNLLGEWSRQFIAFAAFYLYAEIHSALAGETPTLYPAALNLSAVIYLTLTWLLMARATAESTRGWAAAVRVRSSSWQRFLGREASFSSIVMVSLFGLVAAIGLLPGTRRETPELLALYALGVVMAWLVLHTGYALLCAYLYYRTNEGGSSFPAQTPPTSSTSPTSRLPSARPSPPLT